MLTRREPLIILGIDPGLARVGLGVVLHDGQSNKALFADVVSTPASWDLASRLKRIHETIREVARQFKPKAAAIETLYFAANVKTAMQVAQARGVAILATADEGIELFEYTPLQIKQAVAGFGRAKKEQILRMVQILLGLKEPPRSDHMADALAAALCHAQHQRLSRLIALASNKG
jgi:crossover junction endodeoxyribonuclease RuvC